jgi:hypothetical protein
MTSVQYILIRRVLDRGKTNMKYTKKEVDDAFEDYRVAVQEDMFLNKEEVDFRIKRDRVHKAKQLAFARLREVTSN